MDILALIQGSTVSKEYTKIKQFYNANHAKCQQV